MGTSIKIEASRGENTTKEQWDILTKYFEENFGESKGDNDYLTSGVIYCSYSMAELKIVINDKIREELKGSGIDLYFYYLEVEPDDSLTL